MMDKKWRVVRRPRSILNYCRNIVLEGLRKLKRNPTHDSRSLHPKSNGSQQNTDQDC